MLGQTPKLSIYIPFLPPTSNHIYINLRGKGGRKLSPFAEQFKTKFKTYVGEKYLLELGELDLSAAYRLVFKFCFPQEDIFNKNFGKKGGAKSRYKRMDVSNRIKLLEDSLKEVTSIDDSQYFNIEVSKVAAKEPGVFINITPLNEENLWCNELR